MVKVLIYDRDLSRVQKLVSTCGQLGDDIWVATSVRLAIHRLDTELFDVVSLGFDLPERPMGPTGMCVARYIVEMPPKRRPRKVVVHSPNQQGSRLMVLTLTRAGVPVVYDKAPI